MQCEMGYAESSSCCDMSNKRSSQTQMEAIMRSKGEHCLCQHPVLIPQVSWRSKVSCCRCSSMCSWGCLLTAQGNGVCPLFLLVLALICMASASPHPRRTGRECWEEIQAQHWFDNPRFIYRGRAAALSDTTALPGGKCRFNKEYCQWILGQGSILRWEVPGMGSPSCHDTKSWLYLGCSCFAIGLLFFSCGARRFLKGPSETLYSDIPLSWGCFVDWHARPLLLLSLSYFRWGKKAASLLPSTIQKDIE